MQDALEAFELMPDKRWKLEHLMHLGEKLERDPALEIEENRIRGCASNVYLDGWVDDGVMIYAGWADSLIVRGIVVLLCESFSGMTSRTVTENARTIIGEFTQRSGLDLSMIPSRANTFALVVDRMCSIAEAKAL